MAAVAQTVYEICLMDVCSTEGSEQEQVKAMCTAVSVWADICRDIGVTIPWRSAAFCGMFSYCIRCHIDLE